MAARFSPLIFMSIALILMGFAQYPLVRAALGIDDSIRLPMSTTVMLMIGGLMCGLSAMILLVKRQPKKLAYSGDEPTNSLTLVGMHASGLLIFSGIPFANFMLAYHLWLKHRHRSAVLDRAGIEVLNFQISIYLYLLLSLFMVIAALGLITTPLLLIFYAVCVVVAIIQSLRGKAFSYPANIPVIQGRLEAS